MNKSLELALSDMQGEIFEMSVSYGLDSKKFIEAFMLSDIAKKLDSDFNYMQWVGKEYIFECILDELKDDLKECGELYDKETMFWIGFLYRSWHFYTGESSKEIYKQAPAKVVAPAYFSYHTLSVEMAIDRLKESYKDKRNRNH